MLGVVSLVDKKIKVEADITTRKNISGGIGEGFGLIIGRKK